MGREIEKSMIYVVIGDILNKEISRIEAIFYPTKRNRPTLDVLNNLKIEEIKDNHFTIDTDSRLFKPKYTQII